MERTVSREIVGLFSFAFDIVLGHDPDQGGRVKRRVVITGMGAVSPNGVGNAAFSDAILKGKSGIRRITRFDPSEVQVQIAGEVVDFKLIDIV